jgi:hypothetical protein
MWTTTSSIYYALYYQANKEEIGEVCRYSNGTVEVFLKDSTPLLKFERRGNKRYYWVREENRYRHLDKLRR